MLELLAFSRLAESRGISISDESLEEIRSIKLQFMEELEFDLRTGTHRGLTLQSRVTRYLDRGLPAEEAKCRMLTELLIAMAKGEANG
jgi:hypothetical protein